MNNTVQSGSRYGGVPVRNCTAVDTWFSSSPTHLIKRSFTLPFGEPGDEARSPASTEGEAGVGNSSCV